MGKLISWVLFLGLLGITAWIWFGPDDAPPERSRGGGGAIAVSTAEVELRDLSERLRFSGSLIAETRVELAPRVGGRLDLLAVEIGDVVVPGQELARIDPEEFRLELARARSELAVARATVNEAQAALQAAERDLGRVRDLRAQGVSSQADLDAAETRRAAEDARLQLAFAQLEQRESSIQSAELQLSYTEVIAPDGGRGPRLVAGRHVDPGSIVTANTPILTLVDIQPLRAVINVPERDYGRLQVGQPVTIRTDAWPERLFRGEIARLAPVFDETSRQARVEISVPNPSEELRPGMFIRSEIVVGQQEGVPAIPVAALTEREDQRGVFVAESGTDSPGVARFQTLADGVRDGDWVEAPGFPPGTRVVTLGQHLLTDGTAIQFSEEGP